MATKLEESRAAAPRRTLQQPARGRQRPLAIPSLSQEIDLEESSNCGTINNRKWKRENCKGFSGTIPPEIGMATKLEAPALDQ